MKWVNRQNSGGQRVVLELWTHECSHLLKPLCLFTEIVAHGFNGLQGLWRITGVVQANRSVFQRSEDAHCIKDILVLFEIGMPANQRSFGVFKGLEEQLRSWPPLIIDVRKSETPEQEAVNCRY